jgi:hypothetical protein
MAKAKKGTYEVIEKPVGEAQDQGDHRGQIAPGSHKGQEILQPTRSKKLDMPAQAKSMENGEYKLPTIDEKGISTVRTWDQDRDAKLARGK